MTDNNIRIRTLFEDYAIPRGIVESQSSDCISSYYTCVNQNMTKFGIKVYGFIRVGRAMLFEMANHGKVIDVYFVNGPDKLPLFVLKWKQPGTTTEQWYLDVSHNWTLTRYSPDRVSANNESSQEILAINIRSLKHTYINAADIHFIRF